MEIDKLREEKDNLNTKKYKDKIINSLKDSKNV